MNSSPLHQVRHRLEAVEEQLAPHAARSSGTKGRLLPEEESPVRTAYQRDRDRILHCKSFRRLKHKTQVFIAPLGDHYVTRLTHTLEVSQVARTIARALYLNEDLTEAIAMGHDLGHGPFGHVGEQVLSQVSPYSFRHNEQSLRIVDVLENDGQGLNLTWEVRDGILNHSKGRSIAGKERGHPATLEGQVVKLADSIAYLNHDIADAVRAGIITYQDLPALSLKILGETHSQRINTMVCDIIATSLDTPIVKMSPEILSTTDNLRNFMYERVYSMRSTLPEAKKAQRMVAELYDYFIHHPGEMPESLRRGQESRGEPLEKAVFDYIGGMTDVYAMRLFEKLYLPQEWDGDED